jgi:hypothetical protein
MDVGSWLRNLGLGQYEPAFVANVIDSDVLAELTEVDFEKMGIPLGDRKRLMRAISAMVAGSPHAVTKTNIGEDAQNAPGKSIEKRASPSICGKRKTRRLCSSVGMDLLLPAAVANLPNDPQHGMVGDRFDGSDQLREELRPRENGSAQIGRNLAGHGKQYVRIFAELVGEFDERLLTRGRDLAALHPGQIGWGDAASCTYPAASPDEPNRRLSWLTIVDHLGCRGRIREAGSAYEQ